MVKCLACTKGVSFSRYEDSSICLPCASCSKGQVVEQSCSPKWDVKCAKKCSSKDRYNYYYNYSLIVPELIIASVLIVRWIYSESLVIILYVQCVVLILEQAQTVRIVKDNLPPILISLSHRNIYRKFYVSSVACQRLYKSYHYFTG